MYRGLITISKYTPDTLSAMVDGLRHNGLRFSNYWLDTPTVGGKGLVVQFDEMNLPLEYPWDALEDILRRSGVLHARITLEKVELIGQREINLDPYHRAPMEIGAKEF